MKRKMRYKGLPVVDAQRDLEFSVTAKDVSRARKNDPTQCAAALATQRELKLETDVHISRTYVKSKDKDHWIRFITPARIAREIVAFDRAHAFEPGEYVLKAPGDSARLGTYSHRGGRKKKRTGKSRTPRVTVNIREMASRGWQRATK